MKATLLSFSVADIHCRDIDDARSTEERKELFGIYYIPDLFMVCELVLPLIFSLFICPH